jgi:predicted RNA-binding protein YlqC (UPF0109 family)
LKALVERVARALVDDPASVEVREVPGEDGIVLEVRVANDDLGKVIGKRGKTVQSLRTVLAASAAKRGEDAALEIVE